MKNLILQLVLNLLKILKKDSDRYQFVFPYYNYSSILNENILNGFIFRFNRIKQFKDTNNLEPKSLMIYLIKAMT